MFCFKKYFLSFCLFVFLFPGCSHENMVTWKSVEQTIQRNFPAVKYVTVDDMDQLIKNQENFLLIDVRTKEEYEISHIKGAIHLTEPSKVNISKNKKIIAYCSVGYRSARFIQELNQLGYNEAYNLKGSIFQWANEGHAVYQNNQRVFYVHPYNKEWGVLLNKKYHKSFLK